MKGGHMGTMKVKLLRPTRLAEEIDVMRLPEEVVEVSTAEGTALVIAGDAETVKARPKAKPKSR